MCCSTSTLAAATPYITMIGGAFLGASCAYFYGVKLSQRSHDNAAILLKRQEAHKAFLVLEASFLSALRILKRPGTKDFDSIPTLFDNQEIAMLAFVWHLNGESRTDLEEKWQKYKVWQKEYEELEGESERAGLLKMCGSNREILIQIMEDILEAAKEY